MKKKLKITADPTVMKMLTTAAHCVVAIVLLALSPVLIPSHFLLKKSGRRGFYSEKEKAIVIEKESFEKKQ